MLTFLDGYEDAEVRISSDGFSIQEVTIMEGQVRLEFHLQLSFSFTHHLSSASMPIWII